MAAAVQADVFNMPAGQASLQFVTVGDPGNAADTVKMQDDGTTGYGSVPYIYQMGKFDVTVGQYCQFLNAVAATDPYGLYNTSMASSFAACGISRNGGPGSYTYSPTNSCDFPVNYVSWGSAARFCNWLQNSQPTGAEGNGTTETGAYTLSGVTSVADLMAITRDAGAKYFIPTENEWYKAAYYKGGGTNAGYWSYPTQNNYTPNNTLSSSGTNNANYYDMFGTGNHGWTDPTNYLTPVGSFVFSPGPYGTYDMGGDVSQWNEADIGGWCRGFRGGSFLSSPVDLASCSRANYSPTDEDNDVGFRVASLAVPEPDTLALLFVGTIGLQAYAWRRQSIRRI